MDHDEAFELLDAELDKYRHMSFGKLSAKVGHQESLIAVGPSGIEQQIDVQIRWDHEPGGGVRVMASIDNEMFRDACMSFSYNLVRKPEEHHVDSLP